MGRAGRPITNCPYEPYLDELDAARAELGNRICLRAGLELGVQRHTVEKNRALVARLDERLDFVICSIHQVGDLEFWNGDYQRGRTQEQINLAYYEEMLAVARDFRDYDVLGHLDLIRRYDPYGAYPFERVRDVEGLDYDKLVPSLAPHIAKRYGTIAIKSLSKPFTKK